MLGGCYDFEKRIYIVQQNHNCMQETPDDGRKRIEKYLLENATPEGNIPKPDKKPETPKNDDYNEYEISDKENEKEDAGNW